MKWTDISDIAIELSEAHPDKDPLKVNFVDLRDWVLALEDFDDDPSTRGVFGESSGRVVPVAVESFAAAKARREEAARG